MTSVSGTAASVTLGAGAMLTARATAAAPAAGERVVVCIRPEQLRLTSAPGSIDGVVEMGLPLGAMIVHEVRTAERPVDQGRASRAKPAPSR